MYNRAEAVDNNFKEFILKDILPKPLSYSTPQSSGLKSSDIMDMFETQMMSRHLDLYSRILKNQGKCYYTIGSSGHEGNAAIAKALDLKDMAFLHYRSGGFFIQRSKQKHGSTPIYDLMLSFVASSDDPISGGRHKVFGSKELNIPPQTSTIASHLPKAVGTALSIPKAKSLKLNSYLDSNSIVICSFGDASANHASAVSAINTACWMSYQNIPLPIVFVCEDNGIGISVPTPQNWIRANYENKSGLFYVKGDGLNLADTYTATKTASQIARTRKKPVFLHLNTVRLLGHAGSDVENTYRNIEQIEQTEFNDPLLHTARIVLENSFASKEQIIRMYEEVRNRVQYVAESTMQRPVLETPEEVAQSIVVNDEKIKVPNLPLMTEREEVFGKDLNKMNQPFHMAKLINWGLQDIMLQYKNTVIFGEDVAQKGGVYNVTDGIYKKFGSKRVFNSLLDETSILGTAIGLAHNGFLPIPEIQFLAYVHNAEDQIRGEAATLSFFSKGQYKNPMVIRIAGLAYQKGFGGHFHNDNSLAVFRDIPSLILAVPSNGRDAVQMLRTCVEEAYTNGRVCIFVEPIALYMTKDLHEENDKLWSFPYPEPDLKISLGDFAVIEKGTDLLIITYGNGTYYSSQAIQSLKDNYNISSTIVDLRWLTEINFEKLSQTADQFKHILIVDECRKSGSPSESIITGLYENCKTFPKIKRITAVDCFIPLGKMAAAGLPKKDEIIKVALKLLNIEK